MQRLFRLTLKDKNTIDIPALTLARSLFKYYDFKMCRFPYHFTFRTPSSCVGSLAVDVNTIDDVGLAEKGHNFFDSLHRKKELLI